MTPDRSGQVDNVVLSFPTADRFLANAPYFGATCGRFANRIAQGQFSLDGATFQLPCNNGPNHLHGGQVGLTRRNWTIVDKKLISEAQSSVTLEVTSPDGEEGYPGQLRVRVEYSLNPSSELTIRYEADTDRPTCLNLTNHAYWNLQGTQTENRSILGHRLRLDSDQFIPVNETQIPTGELESVVGTAMDFSQMSSLGERIAEVDGGYDHCYALRDANGTLRRAAVVEEPESGRTMEVLTTEPGIQLYTGNFLDGSESCGGFEAREGLCLECQHFPDSPNQPSFPSTRLNPGDVYRQVTIHRFGTKPD